MDRKGNGDAPIQRVTPSPSSQSCYRCGATNHLSSECRFKDAVCHACKKRGHIAKVCRSKKSDSPHRKQQAGRQKKRVNFVDVDQKSEGGEDDLPTFLIGYSRAEADPITVDLTLNGQKTTMELDTGAAVSLISEETYRKLLPTSALKPTSVNLRTYTGQSMSVAGQIEVEVRYQQQTHTLPLFVVTGEGPSLLGRNWLKHLILDWKTIGLVSRCHGEERVKDLLQKYESVFTEGIGTMTQYQAKLTLKPDTTPVFKKPRPVPFTLKDTLSQELDRLESDGIVEKVDHSDWASPIVPVPKGDGKIRICGDYKVTVNSHLQVDQYPLPKPDELFTALVGGKHFTKLDLKHAYQQMLLDEESRKLVTINTHKGLYRYTRLPFGIAPAPAIFQKTMDTILQGLPRVICYIDDILLTGSTDEEHYSNLEEVLKRLQDHGIKLKAEKCSFMQKSVEFLGHRIDREGLHTTPQKIEAIKKAPQPRNVQELRSFLGMVHYYGKFISNLSTLLRPLNQLLQKGKPWRWTAECDTAFNLAKEKLSTAPVLTHYDSSLPLTLAGDASAYGLGAVISHLYPDGTERPVAYASRTLTSAEQNYAQLEKEALSLIFGIKKFHQYLFGRSFQLITDHKPLTTILGPKNGIPPLAAARLQRWALMLASYQYEIKFRPTTSHMNADCLSRLPVSYSSLSDCSSISAVFNIHQIAALPVTAKQIALATQHDPVLSRVLHFTRVGWPQHHSQDELQPYWTKRLELTVEEGCLLWGIRVIIPPTLQDKVLEELHTSHPGISRMKAIARSYTWWPGLDKEIEDLVKSCPACSSLRNAPSVAPLHPWLWPSQPWQRIHIDFAGPIQGKMMLVVVDAHSKWPEVATMTSTTAPATIRVLREMFATYGLPQQLVSDNGPQFTSTEFADFLKQNGIKHIKSAPYHPSTNGAAERFVRTLKHALKCARTDQDQHQQLMSFLLSYRITPHATTNTAPSELFMGRSLRTRLDLLRPNLEESVVRKQAQQKMKHDQHSKFREFQIGQSVLARNYRPGPLWLPGVIEERTGPLSYVVKLGSGLRWKRHVDQLLSSKFQYYTDI